MADSKISQLPLSPYVLDKDLMVVVTGHLEEGAHPDNVKVPLGYIRRYIVRLNLLTSPQSGIGSHYNSGLNILTLQHIPQTGNLMRYDYADEFPYHQTISNTGLNTIRGNLVDITFAKDSDASQRMHYAADGNWNISFVSGNLGDPYHSGIISITGLNAYSGAPWGNLMRLDIDTDTWPHSGILSTTGLNAIVGNGIDIVFNANSPAAQAMDSRDSSWYNDFDSSVNLGNKYHSGVISVTGLNAYSGAPWGNLMRVDYDGAWPHSGILSTTGVNAIKGNLVDIQFAANSEAAEAMHQRNGSWDNAFNKNTNLGNKYHSGIISFTGVNARTENLIVKEYENIWPYTGVYYNTGLNARAGNHIEIMHSTDSDANFFYPGIVGGKYQSGIISVTGLNVSQSTGNLIVNHIDPNWPHRNILHTTGLNISTITGNRTYDTIETIWPHKHVVHTTGLNISNDRNMGRSNTNSLITYDIKSNFPYEYQLHTTGLNVASGDNLIVYDINNNWPYSYKFYTTGLNIVNGNNFLNALNGLAYNIDPDENSYHKYDIFSLNKIKTSSTTQTIINSNSGIGSSRTSISVLDQQAFISYANIGKNKQYDSVKILATFSTRMPNSPFTVSVPPSTPAGSSNDLKIYELGSVTGQSVTIAGVTDNADTDTDSWFPDSLFIDNYNYPLELQISISGNSVFNLDEYPITFTTHINTNFANPVNPSPLTYSLHNNGWIYEKYRTSSIGPGEKWNPVPNTASTGEIFEAYDHSNPFSLDSTESMRISSIVDPAIYSNTTYHIDSCIGIKYTLTNPNYVRQYKKYIGTATIDTDEYTIGDPVYRYHSVTMPAALSFSINTNRYLKCENTEEAPTISIKTHPQSLSTLDDNASFSGLATVSDYTEPYYQWQKAESGTLNFTDIAGANNSIINLSSLTSLDNGDIYRLKVIAYDGLTEAYSSNATLTVATPTITITQQPTDQPIASDNTASFTIFATTPTFVTLVYQWQVNDGSGYSNIAGANSSTLDLNGLSPSDDGNLYRCVISAAGYANVTSESAELHNIAITINAHPSNQTSTRATATFNVTASQTAGSPFTLYYVWERSTNGGSNFFNVQSSTTSSINLTNLTYSNNDSDLYRVKVRLQGFGNDVEAVSTSASLTIQEIEITQQPDINKIYGKDILYPDGTQNLIPTTNGNTTLSTSAIGRNIAGSLYYQWQTGNIPTNPWENPTTWTNIDGATNSSINISSLTENSNYVFYRCLVDDYSFIDDANDSNGVIRKITNTCKITTSTFIARSNIAVDDNTTFATLQINGSSSLSEQDFATICYDLSNGVGYTANIDANTNQTAGLNFGTGLSPLGPTGLARLVAIHPNTDSISVAIGSGPQYSAEDIVNLQVTGSVSQYLARINIPIL